MRTPALASTALYGENWRNFCVPSHRTLPRRCERPGAGRPGRVDMTDVTALEADLAEPLADLIARAERRAIVAKPGHLEFNITARDGDRPEFFRLNGVHFLAHPGESLELAQRFTIEIPAVMDEVTVWVHEAASDVALFWVYPTGRWWEPFRAGDTIAFDLGSIRVKLSQ